MERPPKESQAAGAGYLCFHSAGEDGEWAALLVVSAAGLPLEFLYSGPLRPTPVQAILYQDRLGPEVRLSLVRSLLRGLRSRVACVAARRSDLDGALAQELRCPVLALEGETGNWFTAPNPPAEAVRERIEEAVGAAEPLGRAAAALAYVIEYERSRPRSAD